MKTIQNHLGKLFSTAVCLIVGVVIAASLTWKSIADDVPAPGLMITVTNTTNYITITNGDSLVNYELYRRASLDSAYPWQLLTVGSQGQTNFTATMGLLDASFFQIIVGTNWDGDSAPNFGDGDPVDPSIGWLSITIDSPTNGATFN